jgi:hypothetical protein
VVERVEEKVRIELLAQRVETRLRHFGAQALGDFGLAPAGFGNRESGRDRAVQDGGRHDVAGQHRRERTPLPLEERGVDHEHQERVGDKKQQRQRDMPREGAQAVGATARRSADPAIDERRDQRPRIPLRGAVGERLQERLRKTFGWAARREQHQHDRDRRDEKRQQGVTESRSHRSCGAAGARAGSRAAATVSRQPSS